MIVYRRRSSPTHPPGLCTETRQSFSQREQRALADITNLTSRAREERKPICLASPGRPKNTPDVSARPEECRLPDDFSIFQDLEPPATALERLAGAPAPSRLRTRRRTRPRLSLHAHDVRGVWKRVNRYILSPTPEPDHFWQAGQ